MNSIKSFGPFPSAGFSCKGFPFEALKLDRGNKRVACYTFVSSASIKSEFLYESFVKFAVEKIDQSEELLPFSFSEDFHNMEVRGQQMATLKSVAYTSPKIRLCRAATIDGGTAMQVLNMAIFPRPQYDIPIFCADFFSTLSRNILVLDLNPLFNTQNDREYSEKYYRSLLPLVDKYKEVLPWGGELTAESLDFFSPIVIWSKPSMNVQTQDAIFSAFQDYLLAWVRLNSDAKESTDEEKISKCWEAQHRYLTWRATKDPGRPLLTRLFGENLCERYITEFLFYGVDLPCSKTFVDYFPKYKASDGNINPQRSMSGKLYGKRPWDSNGQFICCT